jgi:hypothetical protein
MNVLTALARLLISAASPLGTMAKLSDTRSSPANEPGRPDVETERFPIDEAEVELTETADFDRWSGGSSSVDEVL